MGKDDKGNVIVEDLTEMPHLVVAGMSNYGVPTFINGMVLSLLMKKHPAELKLVLIGDKRLELMPWGQLERHYLAALPDADNSIVLNKNQYVKTIDSLCVELDGRFNLLIEANVRSIKDYNDKFCQRQLNPAKGHRYLPYIVVLLFESYGYIDKETIPAICKLSQLGKTGGVHLVISTQQLGTDVIHPQIKSNIPSSVAFKVSRMAESNSIMGESCAQYLKRAGEALYKSKDGNKTHFVVSPISDNDIDAVVHNISSQRGYPDVYYLQEYLNEEDSRKEFNAKNKDEFFNDAARLVVVSLFGSTSLLQRKLQLGYNRAGQIIEQLEVAGILGPSNGSKPRDVLIHDETSLEELLKTI